jgi:hypothetical protein
MSNPNKTIENILLNLKHREIRTMEQIRQERNDKIDEVVSDFLCYPKNEENIKKIKEELEGYELVTLEDLYKDDTLMYLNLYYFYDIELSKIRIIAVKEDGKIRVRRWTDTRQSAYKTMDIPPALFRKLTDEDIVKINLVETVYSMKNR